MSKQHVVVIKSMKGLVLGALTGALMGALTVFILHAVLCGVKF